jgi:hypothetical protein
MENFYRIVLVGNRFMKKTIFIAAAFLIGITVSAQKKEKLPPPPPPPPKVDMKSIPPPPKPQEPDKLKSDLPEDYQAFLKRNSTVKNVSWSENNVVRVYLKSGKEEVYHTNIKEERQDLENKYGKLPVPPPPPPKPKAPNEKKQS